MFRIQVPRNPYFQFLFIVLLSFFVFFLILFLSTPFAYIMFGQAGLNPVNLNIDNPADLQILKFYQIVQSIGLFVVPPFIIAYLYPEPVKNYLYLNKSLNAQQIILVIPIVFSILPFINLVAQMNSQVHFPEFLAPLEKKFQFMEKETEKVVTAFLNTKSVSVLLLNLFMIAALPAIGEELMFRGVLQRVFSNMARNVHFGIILSSFLFSAIHMQFYGLFPRWILGMIFGYMLLWSGSIWAPILAHFVNNALGVIGYFMVNKGNINKETLDTGASTDILPYTLLSTVMFFLACYYFYRHSKPTETKV